MAHLAAMLVEAGEQPAILTRGYARRRRADGVVVVSDGTHLLADVDRAGDEPLMLARDVPGRGVLVSEHRALAGALAERVLGATVHLLDDGFQHLALARDIDIVIVAAADCTDRAMPFGRLREPIEALACADAVVADGEAAWRSPHARFRSPRSLGAPVPLEPERSWTCHDRRVVALAGIAEPARFRQALAAAGWQVVDALDFGDHHRYSRVGSFANRGGRGPRAGAGADHGKGRDAPAADASVAGGRSRTCRSPSPSEPETEFRTWLFDQLREARS